LPAREVKFPPYEVRTLANGMRVLAILHHEQPVITMRLMSAPAPPRTRRARAGSPTCSATCSTRARPRARAQEIADQIDTIGGALGTGSGSDLSFANIVVMKDSFGTGMELLADVVRNPKFDAEEIDRQKQQAISSLQVSATDPDFVASALIDRLVYGFHPYGLPGNGTPDTLTGITRDDLVTFHRRISCPTT
jgi:zinc protease